MTLINLIGISLEQIPADSMIPNLSTENRFDVAYKAIMQIANAALQLSGYRTLTSKPGHHQTMIQSLSNTLGIDKHSIIVLDAMRKQRNITDYSEDIVSEGLVKDCILQAQKLLEKFNAKFNHKSLSNPLHLIGWASGIAGVDAAGGQAPMVLQQSPYAAELNLKWDAIIHASETTNLRMDEYIKHLCEQLAQAVSSLVKAGEKPCVIGGDHTCAIGTWSGVYDAMHDKGDLGLIWIDAHMDSHTPETSESGRIHGMPLAALLGYGYPTLTSILHYAPKLKPENVCLIGVRSFEAGEAALLKRLNVRVYFMDEVKERGFATVLQEALMKVKRETAGFGLTLDLDALDPEEVPGVDVPEPDGILVKDLRTGLANVLSDPALLATEIVEFDPSRDKNQATEQLIVELLAMIAR